MVGAMKIMPWTPVPLPRRLPAFATAQGSPAPQDRVTLSGVAPQPQRGRLPHGMVEVGGGAVRYGPGAGALRARLEERGVRLVGIRHGQTERNASPVPVLCGQNETRLTAKGREQAAEAARRLFDELGGSDWLRDPSQVPVVYASPLSRARETAQALADLVAERGGVLPIVIDERLLEIHFGSFENRAVPEMWAERPDFAKTWDSFDGQGANFMERFPGGESRADVVNRVADFLEDVAREHPGRTVLTFCHQETLVAARAALGLSRTAEGKLRADAPAIHNATPLALTRPPVPSVLFL